MKNSFDKQKEFSGKMEEDLERIRGELGKGIKLEEIAEKKPEAKVQKQAHSVFSPQKQLR